jgi:hypothetical protein
MLKKTTTYTDFMGNERTEDCYFNLTKSELTKLSLSVNGGLDQMLENMVKEQDQAALMDWFDKIILMSYGRRSLDGKRFEKSPEISREFSQTGAYDQIFMELVTGGADKVAEFIKGVIPADLAAEAAKQQAQMTVVK